MDVIRVRVADPNGASVVLWERHPEHPDGEVWLQGAGEFVVAATPAVVARLRDGRLVQVGPAAASTPVGTGERPEKDPQVETEVPARSRPPGGRKDAPGDESDGRVLAAEELDEDVSIVTSETGAEVPRSRVQRKPRGSA